MNIARNIKNYRYDYYNINNHIIILVIYKINGVTTTTTIITI